jgi:hypothetical protein
MKILVDSLDAEAERREKQASQVESIYPLDAFVYRQIAESLHKMADDVRKRTEVKMASVWGATLPDVFGWHTPFDED